MYHVRGPHGNVPKVSGKIMLVGGGTGIAALYPFAQVHGHNTVAVLGARDKAHLYNSPFFQHCDEVYSFTEDGIGATPGMVTDGLKKLLRFEKPDFCLNCGPLGMIKAVVAIAKAYLFVLK